MTNRNKLIKYNLLKTAVVNFIIIEKNIQIHADMWYGVTAQAYDLN